MRTALLLASISVAAAGPAYASPTAIASNGIWTTYRDTDSPTKTCAVQAGVNGGKFTIWGGTDRQNVLRVSLYKPAWQIPDLPVPIVLTFSSGAVLRLSGSGKGALIRVDVPQDLVRPLVHYFTADATVTLTLPEGHEAPWLLDLTGTTPSTLAMTKCIDAAALLLPPPFQPPSAAVASGAGFATHAPLSVDSTETQPDALATSPPLPISSQSLQGPAPTTGVSNSSSGLVESDAQSDQSATTAEQADSTAVSFETALSTMLILGLAGCGLWAVLTRSSRKKERLLSSIKDEIDSNAQALRVKRLHTVQPDDYGTVKFDKWIEAKKYYKDTRIIPIVVSGGYRKWPPGLEAEVEILIEVAATKPPAQEIGPASNFMSSPEVFDARMEPIDYEMFCALQLQRAGWDTRTTVTTGDQGADVIAKQAGKTLVVQCKLYSSPVGNDAVQQAFAAKTFQSAQFAAVVSNQPFTRSAKQLASVSSVYLLHHDELASFRPAQVRV